MSISVQTERMLTDRFALLSIADVLGEQLGRRTKVDLGVVSDVQTTLRALIPLLRQKADGRHLDASFQHYRKARGGLDELAVGTPGRTPIHP